MTTKSPENDLEFIQDEDVFASKVFTDGSGSLIIEDFVRNFLVQNGLLETFNTFQVEWYKKSSETKNNNNNSVKSVVSDENKNLLLQNQNLFSQNKLLRQELLRKEEELAYEFSFVFLIGLLGKVRLVSYDI
jgi:hypothetical protein